MPKAGATTRRLWAFEVDDKGVAKRDPSFKHPRCVMNLMAAHYARYTPAKVADATGIPEKKLLRIYEAYTATGKPDKAGTILYGMGWTQKSVGSRISVPCPSSSSCSAMSAWPAAA